MLVGGKNKVWCDCSAWCCIQSEEMVLNCEAAFLIHEWIPGTLKGDLGQQSFHFSWKKLHLPLKSEKKVFALCQWFYCVSLSNLLCWALTQTLNSMKAFKCPSLTWTGMNPDCYLKIYNWHFIINLKQNLQSHRDTAVFFWSMLHVKVLFNFSECILNHLQLSQKMWPLTVNID